MMTRLRQRLFSLLHRYPSPLDHQRAQVLLYLNVVVIAVTLVSIVLIQIPNALNNAMLDVAGIISSVAVIMAAAVSHQLIQRGRLRPGIWIIVGALIMGALSAIWFSSGNGIPSLSSATIIILPVPIVVASVLVSRRDLLLISVLIIVAVIGAGFVESSTTSNDTVVSNMMLIVIALVGILTVLILFLGSLQQMVNAAFEVDNQQQWVNQLALSMGTIKNESELLGTLLAQTRRTFNRHMIEVFLVNDEGHLNNVAGAGQRRISIRSIDTNIVAEAARSRGLLTASAEDDPAQRNHMNAAANYAAAIPLLLGTDLFGVLDVQAAQPFSRNELHIFRQLAEQLTLALHRVRRTTELDMQLIDYEKTIKRLQNQLQEYDVRQRQSVAEVWSGYVASRGRKAIGYNLEAAQAEPVPAADLPARIESALKTDQLEITTQGSEQIINVPIRFRDTNLGAMSFAVPASQSISERQVEVVTVVAERLAMALENTRLFEQSQSQALRERKASEVAAALIGATDVRVVLNLAAEQFREALGAVNTRIFIQPETLMEPLAQTQQEQSR